MKVNSDACVSLSLPASCHWCCSVCCAALIICPHNHPPAEEKTKAKEQGNTIKVLFYKR